MARKKAAAAASKKARRYWLLKSEPECFAFADLMKAPRKRTTWDGVRNYQARNFLRDDCAVGDLVLFHHSSANPPGIAGIARVSRGAHPDPTQFDPSADHFDAKSKRDDPPWVQIEIEGLAVLPRFVPIDDLRADPRLARMRLLQRGQRLSVMPVEPGEWRAVLERGGLDPDEF